MTTITVTIDDGESEPHTVELPAASPEAAYFLCLFEEAFQKEL